MATCSMVDVVCHVSSCSMAYVVCHVSSCCAAVGIRAPQPTILNTVQFLVQDQFMKADNIFYTSIEGGKAVI